MELEMPYVLLRCLYKLSIFANKGHHGNKLGGWYQFVLLRVPVNSAAARSCSHCRYYQIKIKRDWCLLFRHVNPAEHNELRQFNWDSSFIRSYTQGLHLRSILKKMVIIVKIPIAYFTCPKHLFCKRFLYLRTKNLTMNIWKNWRAEACLGKATVDTASQHILPAKRIARRALANQHP